MKFTKAEKSWILYDVANSAFTLVTSATLPIWFAYLYGLNPIGEIPATTFFAITTSLSVAIIAFLSPLMGAIADHKGMKRKLFVGSIAIGILGGLAFSGITNWGLFLVLFVISRTGYSLANVFYDSMLVDVTTDEKMDSLSAYGYAFGYVGSTIPFILGIILVMMPETFGLTTSTATQLSFVIALVWWLLFTIPLLRNVKQTYYREKETHIISKSFKQIAVTFGKIRANKKMFLYIIAYFFYIDGVYTIISMASIFGAEVGLETNGLIMALLLTQFVAFPFAILASILAKKFGVLTMLKGYVAIYGFVAVFGFTITAAEPWKFWMLAVIVGLAQGGVQSLSRSYFGKLVPKENSNEYFGFFDIFGKYADLLGPLLMALSGFLFHETRYAILFMVTFFIFGFYLLNKISKMEKEEKLAK
jgi:UMF1 family MFS transporter